MTSAVIRRKKISSINLTAMAIGFLDAFLIYILSSYVEPLTGEQALGAFYVVAFSAVFLTLFLFHKLIDLMGQSRTLYFFLGLAIISSVLLSHFEPSYLLLIVTVIFLVATTGSYVALDILLESYSEDSLSGHIRGMNLTLLNLGFLLAPFLSVLVLKEFGYSGVFFVLTLGYSIVFLFTLIVFRTDNHKIQQKITFFHSINKIWKERDLRRIYGVSFVIEFFYALMVVYMPLHLLALGVSWQEIGILFTIMLLPFVLLQYPIGVLADKRKKEKGLLVFFLCIAFLSTYAFLFVHSKAILLIGFLLFMTRVGAAGVDVLRDSFFYKQISGDDTDLIAFFRTTRSLAHIAGAGIMFVVLAVLPLTTFLFIASVMLFLGLILALRLNK